jgi:hypothetical protein
MGQYYKIVNLDRREWISPHAFREGSKLMEFSLSGCGVLSGLSVLLASSNGEGGGDLFVDAGWEDIPGLWAGDRIVIAGEYDEKEGSPGRGVFDLCGPSSDLEKVLNAAGELELYIDISSRVLGALLSDPYFRDNFTYLKEGSPGAAHFDQEQRELWASARPGEPFPRDGKNNNNI